MNAKELPSREELLEYFTFDFENGEVYWKKKPSKYSTRKVGDVATTIGKNEKGYTYKRIYFNNSTWKCSRIIYQAYYGDLGCDEDIDHADGNSLNNVILNLRKATNIQNGFNISMDSERSATTHRNILKHTDRRKNPIVTGWRVYITKLGKSYTKVFPDTKYTIEDAIRWRDTKRKELFGDFAGY